MKKISVLSVLISAIISVCISNTSYADNAEVIQPKVEAKAAILMDYKTGRVLWEKDSEAPMAMASTTKIMTAILTLEKGNLGDIVTVSSRAASAPEVNMNLRTGEKIYLRDLLYALMLQSSNDAAVAIAEHISGTVEQFCDQMTQKAKELGATDTIFRTPNGLDKDDHHSTAKDLAIITRYALENPQFVDIINTKGLTTTNSEKGFTAHVITNKNRLLNEYNGALGVKTGFTGKAGQCFVGAAKRGDMELISVVLASGWGERGKQQKWVDTKAILDYGFKNYEYVDVVISGSDVGIVSIERAKQQQLSVALSNGLTLPLNQNERDSIETKINLPAVTTAPIKKGDVLGTQEIFLDDQKVAEIDLVAVESIDRHDFQTSLMKVMDTLVDLISK